MQTINERIKLIRMDNHLKQKDFSELLGIPRSSLSEIENGKRSPNIEIIVRISNKLKKTNLDWILNGIGKMYQETPGAEKTATLHNLPTAGNAAIKNDVHYPEAEKMRTALDLSPRMFAMMQLMEALPDQEQEEILEIASKKERINALEQEVAALKAM